ncbi:Peptidase aspartic [Metarhizium album ARSEF 1941]|uniref:Peptidase aspartic n=1 Tax=Metarhizium album (strain ARSEF 1941) TaxID=1081103 RepID=A0A0B2WLR1_METAS|nr:Peptidase aspartic [Metarhizium album ARSEF 1941]KHN93955.1 Peptidase aspartic [Metarhizium album ARSEF 1941]
MTPFETLLVLLASTALASTADSREQAIPKPVVKNGVLQLPLVTIHPEPDTADGNLTRRQVAADFDMRDYTGPRAVAALGIPLQVGTPPQTVFVEPDTGSSPFWVPNLPPGLSREGPLPVYFDLAASKTSRDLHRPEKMSYAGEKAYTQLFMDEVAIAGRSLGMFRMGVANVSQSNLGRIVGTLGLLPPSAPEWADSFILKRLVDRKITQSQAFGAGIRNRGRGSLTLGGYDTAKFSGRLEKFPIVPNKNDNYVMKMQTVTLSTGGGKQTTVLDTSLTDGKPVTIGLDTGAPVVVFAYEIFKAVAQNLGAGLEKGLVTLPCDLVDSKGSLDLRMSDSTTISLPLADLLVGRLDDGKRCMMAIQPYLNSRLPSHVWLGTHFLRRSFVVYDPIDRNIYIAAAADCGSNLVAINGAMPDDVTGDCAPEAQEIDPPTDKVQSELLGLTEEEIAAYLDPRIDDAADGKA